MDQSGVLKNIVMNERGVLTLDFIFATAIVFGFTIIFFAITFMLSMVEVSQYITYTAARSYLPAQESPDQQAALGKAKFDEIMSTNPFKGLFLNKWIVLSEPQFGDFTDNYPETNPDNRIFVGARVPFEAKVLHLHLPLLGDTATNDSTGKATLNAYLMREVTNQECRENFNRARYSQLKQLYTDIPNGTQDALITDNGC